MTGEHMVCLVYHQLMVLAGASVESCCNWRLLLLTMVKPWSIATVMMMYSDLGRTDTRTSRDALLVEFPHRRSRWRSRMRVGGPRRPQRQ